jgi:bacillithiol system protein YtxJ
MNWIELSSLAQLNEIIEMSDTQPIVLFKHSTKCSISSMSKARLEREVPKAGVDFYLLDLLRHRDLSNAIAELFSVKHESPQVLLIFKGECVYDESHNGITMAALNEQMITIV